MQEDEENTSTELVFDEFEEVIARIFNVAVFQPMVQAGNTANLAFFDYPKRRKS